ncbi:MAG: hypothetical protein JWP11_3665 [Frankiales bacterium]|nr:hypothetical protein [Frankiales bacterium]
MTAPELLPLLSAGPHPGPEHGACLNEYLAYLAGEPWTDNPRTVHAALRRLAAHVNDTTSDARRHHLALCIPRLLDTASTGERVDVLLGGWLAMQAPASRARRRLLRESTRWARRLTGHEAPSGAGLSFAVEAVDLHVPWLHARSTRDDDRRRLLEQTCDRYDTLTGRYISPLAPEQWAACRALVPAR